jgi:hypothetical protein
MYILSSTPPCPDSSKSDSMVEIKHSDLERSPIDGMNHEDDKYRLVYSKSKVYVNPTAYARDNIAGFVALVKKVRGLVQSIGIYCSLSSP